MGRVGLSRGPCPPNSPPIKKRPGAPPPTHIHSSSSSSSINQPMSCPPPLPNHTPHPPTHPPTHSTLREQTSILLQISARPSPVGWGGGGADPPTALFISRALDIHFPSRIYQTKALFFLFLFVYDRGGTRVGGWLGGWIKDSLSDPPRSWGPQRGSRRRGGGGGVGGWVGGLRELGGGEGGEKGWEGVAGLGREGGGVGDGT